MSFVSSTLFPIAALCSALTSDWPSPRLETYTSNSTSTRPGSSSEDAGPWLLGFSGVVDRVGLDAGVSVGDRVVGITFFGAYSERVLVPTRQLFGIPRGLTMAQAAAFPSVAGTALHALSLAGFWPQLPPTRMQGYFCLCRETFPLAGEAFAVAQSLLTLRKFSPSSPQGSVALLRLDIAGCTQLPKLCILCVHLLLQTRHLHLTLRH